MSDWYRYGDTNQTSISGLPGQPVTRDPVATVVTRGRRSGGGGGLGRPRRAAGDRVDGQLAGVEAVAVAGQPVAQRPDIAHGPVPLRLAIPAQVVELVQQDRADGR